MTVYIVFSSHNDDIEGVYDSLEVAEQTAKNLTTGCCKYEVEEWEVTSSEI